MIRHLSIHPQFLDALLTQMRQDGYEFVDLGSAVERLAVRSPQARRFAVITADDGYRDNLLEALPVLERHRAPMTIYVAPALIDGTATMWWEVVEAIVEKCDLVTVPADGGPARLESVTPVQKRAANRWLQDHLSRRVSEAERDGLVAALAIAHGVDPDGPRRDLLMDWDEIARIAADMTLVATSAGVVLWYYDLFAVRFVARKVFAFAR